MAFRILVAEDEQITLNNIVETLAEEGYQAAGVADGAEALRRIEHGTFDLLISDIKMPGRTGLELLETIREHYPQTEVILITGYGSISAAVDAMRGGASDYVTKPFDLDELLLKVGKIARQKTLKREHAALRTFAGLDRKISIIAKSPGMSHETADMIFEPFFTTKDRGTGLGLAIVFNIIQKHGGSIQVDSTEGTGTTFVVTLPKAAPANGRVAFTSSSQK